MEEQLVSIIVPIYNVEQYVEDCLKSITMQTYKNIEIIVVNDGATDSSLEKCRKIAETDGRIQIISQKNSGLPSAVKRGICEASGDYFVFVDSDDWIDAGYVSSLLECAKSTGADIVVCNALKSNGSFHQIFYTHQLKNNIYDRKEIQDYIMPILINSGNIGSGAIMPCRWAKMFKKSIIYENLVFYNEKISSGEDWLLTYSCLLDAECIAVCSDTNGYYYRSNPNSMTRAYRNGYIENNVLRYQKMRQMLQQKGREDMETQLKKAFLNTKISELVNLSRNHNLSFIARKKEVLRIISTLNIFPGEYDTVFENNTIITKSIFFLLKNRLAGILTVLIMKVYR